MANKVTAHNTINTIRNDLIATNKKLNNKFQELLDYMICKTTLSSFTGDMANTIKSCLKTLEQTLCRAQIAVTAIAGSTAKVPEKRISFNLSAHKRLHSIDIDVKAAGNELGNGLTSISLIKNDYNQYISRLDGCKAQIASLPVENQELNSISVIESTFTGLYASMFGGSNKADVVKKAKQAFVNNIAEAERVIHELNSIIDHYTNSGSKLARLLNEFDSCENNVFNRCEQAFVKKYKDRTSAYTESNVPEEGTLQAGINEITAASNEWYAIRGQECKKLKDEVTRLKNIYDSVYGTVTLTPNMEGHSMKQTDYYLPNKGSNIGCCATAYAIGMSIVNGRYYNPENTFTDQCVWSWGGVENYQSGINFQQVYDKLKQGKPVMFHYGFGQKDRNGYRPQHWVLINGINTGANYEQLDYKDFKIIDPGAGETEKNLGDLVNSTSGFVQYGYKCFS